MYNDLAVFALYLVILLLLAWPLGIYIKKVFSMEKTVFDPLFHPVEKIIYRLCGVNAGEEMNWHQYAGALICFNLAGMVAVLIVQLAQSALLFNPESLEGVAPWHLTVNTAVSFMTNTNWQAYGGETTMSYFTQMTALTVQNFLSAATGIAVAVALIRGLARKKAGTIDSKHLVL